MFAKNLIQSTDLASEVKMLRFLLTPLGLSVTSDPSSRIAPARPLWKSYLHALVSMEGDVVVYFLCMNITWIPKLTAVH